MHDFVFHNPTRVIFGRGAIMEIGRQTALLGQKVLLVHGRSSIHLHGIFPAVHGALDRAGLRVFIHGGVAPNPEIQQVREGIELARKEGTDVVVAVGGGSVMDTAKAIAAGVAVRHDPWLFFRGKKSIRSALPIVCAPTIAGSGSETNSGMVMGNAATSQKIGIGNRRLFPKTAILDPDLTTTVPPAAAVFAAVDAISHLLEFYLHRQEDFTPLQDHYSEGLMRTLMENCQGLLTDPADVHNRAGLLWAASLALNGLSTAGLGRVGFPLHMIEHSLSALYDVPHGAGLAAILPGAMAFEARRAPGRYARFAAKVLDIAGADEKRLAARGVHGFARWLHTVGAPTCLADLSIPERDIPDIAANTREQARLWRLDHYPPRVVETMLRECLKQDWRQENRNIPPAPRSESR